MVVTTIIRYITFIKIFIFFLFQELSDLLNNLHQLYVKRLWHQLTEVLLALVQRPELQDGDKLWQLYTNVIADFELKYVG